MQVVPEWRQYEWLITKIFHDELHDLETRVLYDSRIRGKYSERSRQIDILVKSTSKSTIIECKHYSEPVDLKAIESFLGMYADTSADFGLVVSSSGFTQSAIKRVKELKGLVTLEHLSWESAYAESFEEQTYGRISDLCTSCIKEYRAGEEVPGLLCWKHGFGVEKEGKVSQFSIAKCLKCAQLYIYCDCCGYVNEPENEELCCTLSQGLFDWYVANCKE